MSRQKSTDTDSIPYKSSHTKTLRQKRIDIDKTRHKTVKSGQQPKIKMINIITDNSIPEIDFKKLENSLLKVNNNQDLYTSTEKHSINIQLLGNTDIINLNKEFRDKDYLPDVLSVDYRQEKMFDHELSGEVFISLEKAKIQADDKGHSLNEELIFLAIHGILHVLGFDHKNDQQELEMKKFEELILAQYKN